MAIAVLDTDLLTASGNITIPANCTKIFALVFGSEDAPRINGGLMGKIQAVSATTKTPAISVFQCEVSQDNVTVPFVISGTHVTLKYTSGAGMYRPDVLLGHSATGTLTGTLPASTTDLALSIMGGMIGPCTIKGDTVAFNYDRNDTFLKTGHMTPGDTSLDCEIKDTGVSAGYNIPVPSIEHAAVLVKASWESWEPELHYVSWNYLYMGGGWRVYGEYDNGVATGNTRNDSSPIPSGRTYYKYIYTIHPAIYTPAWTETFPDIVVPGGEQASVSGMVVLIQTNVAQEFVPKIVIGG